MGCTRSGGSTRQEPGRRPGSARSRDTRERRGGSALHPPRVAPSEGSRSRAGGRRAGGRGRDGRSCRSDRLSSKLLLVSFFARRGSLKAGKPPLRGIPQSLLERVVGLPAEYALRARRIRDEGRKILIRRLAGAEADELWISPDRCDRERVGAHGRRAAGTDVIE